jgi:filamentous hemagglutinin family protein
MGKEIETPKFSELSDDEIDTLIEEIDFEKGTRGPGEPSRNKKEEIIEEALADSDGEYSEFDVFTGDEDYFEAKSGDIKREEYILPKLIRYRVQQIKGNIRSSGEMVIVAKSGTFTDNRDGGLNTLGEFIDSTEYMKKDTLDW